MKKVHPPAAIGHLAEKEYLIEESERFIHQSGYATNQLVPYATFRSNDTLIKHQVGHWGKREFSDLIRNGLLHFIPSYYWEVVWTDPNRVAEYSLDLGGKKKPGGLVVFKTTHAPDGTIQSYSSESNDLQPLSTDGYTLGLVFRFELPSEQTRVIGSSSSSSFNQFADTELSERPTKQPEDILQTYLNRSVWKSNLIKIDSIYTSIDDTLTTTHILLKPDNDLFQHHVEVTAVVCPYGRLHRLDHDIELAADIHESTGSISVFFRFIFYMLFVLLVLILFVRRVFYRLVDLKTSAIYAGIAVFLIILQLIYWLIQVSAFDNMDVDFQSLLVLSIIIIFIAFFFSLVIFMVTGLGESMTREFQADKLTTFSLVRHGYFRKKILGHSFIYGVLFSLIFLGISSVIYALMPGVYLNPIPENLFYAHSYLSSHWHILSKSLFWAFFLSLCVYACFVSWIGTLKKNDILLIAIGAFSFALASSHSITTETVAADLLFWVIPGAVITWVFLRYDLLSLLISIFFFKAVWNIVDGLLLTNSPDIMPVITIFTLMFAVLAAGIWLTVYGFDHEHTPEITPAYIHQIARQQKISRELEIAREVHQTFLPDNLPSPTGLKIDAICQAAFDVGGDYYDAIQIDDNRLAFIIGDVSGKGIQAAFYMTMVKGIFQSLVKEIPDPIPLLTRINRLFYDNAQRGSFISLCYGLLDIKEGRLRMVRAGHNPPAFLSQKEPSRFLRPEGIAIGLTKDDTFENTLKEFSISMKKGDVVIFYTDGVTETTNPRNDMFGEDRLLQTLSKIKHLPPNAMISQLSNTLYSFSSDKKAADDMTLLVVRYE